LPSPTAEKTLRDYLNYSRKKYLLELKLFATTPIENYVVNKELPLPPVLQHFEWFLKVLLRRSESLLKIPVNRKTEEKLNKLIRELKRKLLSTYEDLVEEEKVYQEKIQNVPTPVEKIKK